VSEPLVIPPSLFWLSGRTIILLAALAFVIFAIRQEEKIKPNKDKTLWWDDGGQYNRWPPTEAA
jgi:hypothetical protein